MDQVLNHHLYEYKKGLRRLILHTVLKNEVPGIIERFERSGIAYEVVPLGSQRANIFFGDNVCIEIIKTIGKSRLTDYTPEEDFILGTMLGYCRRQQCERYLKFKQSSFRPENILAG